MGQKRLVQKNASVVVAGGLPLGVEETRPVLALELLLQVPVEENLYVSTARAHGEHSEVLRGLQPAEHEGAQDGGEGAPVPHQLPVVKRKRRFVQGAHQRARRVDASLVERSAQVRADVGRRVDGALQVGRDEDLLAVLRDAHELPRCDVGRFKHGNPLLL